MVEMKLDRELILAIPFMLGSLISLGMVQGDVLVAVDLGQVVYEGYGMRLTPAHALQIVPLVAIVVNRDLGALEQIRALTAIEAWVVYVTVALVVAPPLLPELAGTLAHQPIAYVTFAVQTIGLGIISFVN